MVVGLIDKDTSFAVENAAISKISGSDTMKKKIASAYEKFPPRYSPCLDRDIAEFILGRLGGEVIADTTEPEIPGMIY